jgi:hypothetical protein
MLSVARALIFSLSLSLSLSLSHSRGCLCGTCGPLLVVRTHYLGTQNVMKMGPLGKVMSMIPGMSQMMTKGAEHESQASVCRVLSLHAWRW